MSKFFFIRTKSIRRIKEKNNEALLTLTNKPWQIALLRMEEFDHFAD